MTLSPYRRALQTRHDLDGVIRAFFREQGFLEVSTPIRIPCPALEDYIDAEEAGDWYLRTSPELHMKRLLGAGFDRIFQLGPCFRKGERGKRHNPEFTMLEWYRTSANYRDILDDTQNLFRRIWKQQGDSRCTYQGTVLSIDAPWEIMSVRDAFLRWAGWDPIEHYDQDRFGTDLVDLVEPNLDPSTPTVLMDYPVKEGALARVKPTDPRIAERWELYLGGLELANAFSELTDAQQQITRFETCAKARQARGQPVYPVDKEFIESLQRGIPPSGGIALGIDRLVMMLCNASALCEVLPFYDL
jgi:lysyl-tRNA synthetase class 2